MREFLSPYCALKSLCSLTKRSASDSSPAGAEDCAGSAELVVEAGASDSEAGMDEVGSRSTDEASPVGSGAKTPVLTEESEAEAEAEADSTAEEASALAVALALTLTLALAEGRVQALFFATGDPSAGAARARAGRR